MPHQRQRERHGIGRSGHSQPIVAQVEQADTQRVDSFDETNARFLLARFILGAFARANAHRAERKASVEKCESTRVSSSTGRANECSEQASLSFATTTTSTTSTTSANHGNSATNRPRPCANRQCAIANEPKSTADCANSATSPNKQLGDQHHGFFH